MKRIIHLSLACLLVWMVSAKPADNHGEEEARTFEDLSPEESKARLGKIVEKIDNDGDGKLDVQELKIWIEKQQKSYVFKDVDAQWAGHNVDGDDIITFDEYNKTSYSGLPEEELLKLDEAEQIDFREMIKRDKRRWVGADTSRDGSLNKEEFSAFLHPEEFDHMRDVVIDETMDDIDKDNDGYVSLEEYIGDMFVSQNGEDEPDWVKTEREQFGEYRDKNNDGIMDRAEVGDWIMPRDYDHAEAEARHLVHESDKDNDKKLTKQEIMDQYDLFVGSQVTDFGEALIKHDEF
ncbi:calumenin-like isoform X2 [Antedon mediterranea]|uniref:calumenin-like isoform X2 n=1 Tax=Antedon mediterranea TaxID=105859 RepID=UPI003AF5009A